MRISTSMLKRFYDNEELNLEVIADVANEHIAEVESFAKLIDSDKVVVGYVKEKEKHPNADKLSVCQVDLGHGITEQIVCGADNVEAGQFVVVAKVGAVLPGNFQIKETTIRDVESKGMICSLEELGFDKKALKAEFSEGIYYFDEAKPLGANALKELNLDQGYLELDLTPNRADLLSVLGFAYDLAAAMGEKVTFEEPEVKELGPSNPLQVKIENEDCVRYYARYLDNITVKPSPLWMQADLIASGIRPINNVVDITNYVLLEFGTPLHAFDANKFGSTNIVVKKATDLEEVMTLDEHMRILRADDIVITNGQRVTALGGVMGLFNTRVDDFTTSIILEAASFKSDAVRQTSRRLDLISDSSIRFERGLDETRVRKAINRAADLLVKYANARVYQGIAFAGEPFEKPTVIHITPREINDYLGTDLDESDIINLFSGLNIIQTKPYHFLMPTYRNDLKIKADLIEEIARVYGYNHIPTTYPKSELIGSYTEKQTFVHQIRKQMADLGFNEVINYSLIDPENISLYTNKSHDLVKLLHPIREDRSTLRHSLINGLVDNVNYHLARQIDRLSFFEVGSIYFTEYEPTMLAAIITGDFIDGSFTKETIKSSFYTLKGILENIFKKYNVELKTVKTTDYEGLHPGVSANIVANEKVIGRIGKIHPSILKDAYAFEINLDEFYEASSAQTKFKPVSKYPNISRDIAVIVDKAIPVDSLMELIKQTTRKYLTDITVFDLYYDSKFGDDKVSVAFGLTFNSVEKTLQTEDIDKLMKSVIFRLEKEFSAEIRQ